MKKLFRNLILSMCILPLAFTFVGCKDEEETEAPEKIVPPPAVSSVISTINSVIDLDTLSATFNGDFDYNYSKKTDGTITDSKTMDYEGLSLKADGVNYYLSVPNQTEIYMNQGVLYSRDMLDSVWGDWEIDYNNLTDKLLADKTGLDNLDSIIEPIFKEIVTNLDNFNDDNVTTAQLDSGAYQLNIGIDIAPALNTIRTHINDTYALDNPNKTLEDFIDRLLSEKDSTYSLSDMVDELVGTSSIEPYIDKNTTVRELINYVADKFDITIKNTIRYGLTAYYLTSSRTSTMFGAKASAEMLLDTKIYTAINTLKLFMDKDADTSAEVTETDLRTTVNNFVDDYLRNNTYTVKKIIDKLSDMLEKLTGKDLDLYTILSTSSFGTCKANLSIITDAKRNAIDHITAGLDISFYRTTLVSEKTSTITYDLVSNLDVLVSDWGTTTLTSPTVSYDDVKSIDITVFVSGLYENTGHYETIITDLVGSDFEIADGDYICSYTSSNNKLHITSPISNFLLDINDTSDSIIRKATFEKDLSPTLNIKVSFIYIEEIL